MKFFRIAKWEKYQHYHKPRPPWLKFYTSVNDLNTDWRPLKDHQLGQLMRLMAHAALNDNTMPFDNDLIKETLDLDQEIDLQSFAEVGAITVFPDRASCLSREKSRIKSRQNTIAPSSEVRDQSSEEENRVKKEEKKKDSPPGKRTDALVVLGFLNKTTGRNFSRSADIEACLKRESCTVEDCQAVIRFKWGEWAGTEMAKHLNTTTPFRASHFQSYLDESRAGPVSTTGEPERHQIGPDGERMAQWEINMDRDFKEMERNENEQISSEE